MRPHFMSLYYRLSPRNRFSIHFMHSVCVCESWALFLFKHKKVYAICLAGSIFFFALSLHSSFFFDHFFSFRFISSYFDFDTQKILSYFHINCSRIRNCVLHSRRMYIQISNNLNGHYNCFVSPQIWWFAMIIACWMWIKNLNWIEKLQNWIEMIGQKHASRSKHLCTNIYHFKNIIYFAHLQEILFTI